ncbi:hypothetical protein [Sebaldella sp. S0638]|uniref:hypothetical protein n=1 Tax=Sebaldella sp. S0638 TaxID=2957809 RepID=UPI0020A1E04B|nr:hypothetical protein [Sebaldella sp. S0638]MCP1226544.1 hypothetical protein [Sebaldella sp. S0638]
MLKTIISTLLGIFLFISCSGKSEKENFETGLKYYTKNDYTKAEKYFKKSGSFENGIGLNYLGNIYLVKNENKLAEKYYKLAIDKGNLTAVKNLAYLYTKLQGVCKKVCKLNLI